MRVSSHICEHIQRSVLAGMGVLLLLPTALFASSSPDCSGDSFLPEASALEPIEVIQDVDHAVPASIRIGRKEFRKTSAVDRVEFGEVLLDPTTHRSQTLRFTVPPQAVSFSINILSDGPSSYDYSNVFELVDPHGNQVIGPDPLIDPDRLKNGAWPQQFSPNAIIPGAFSIISSTLVPNTPTVSVVPGVWQLTIARDGVQETELEAKRRVVILIKRQSGAPSKKRIATLRMNLFFAPGNTVGDAVVFEQMARAGAPSILKGRLKEFAEFYHSIGIYPEIAKIQNIDARFNAAAMDGNTLIPNPEFSELITGFPAKDNEINVFFLKPSNHTGYAGIALLNGLGSTYLDHKTFAPAVVIQANRDPARTLAHEMGHSLGLYHTNQDHLADTQAINHFHHGNEGDESNLMAEGRGDLALSPSQLFVIMRNPGLAMYEPNGKQLKRKTESSVPPSVVQLR